MPENEMPIHPGKIIYLNGNTDEVIREMPIEDVPSNMRYVETDDGFVPVVKVIATTVDNQRFIRQYGPNDEFLSETIQTK